jgi:hypothetical protein
MGRKTTKNRLADARDALATAKTALAALEQQRSDALLRTDDDAKARRIDDELEQMRRLVQRFQDKLALLAPEVEREEQERRFPPNLTDARERLATLQRRRDALMRRSKLDSSAAADHELQMLSNDIAALASHVRIMADQHNKQPG